MIIKYKLNKLRDRVYHCTIEDRYDLAMTFCRVQEFYESPYKQIRGAYFTMLEFMSIYSKDRDGSFTYPIDWGGFNVPGDIVSKLFTLFYPSDYNEYDATLEDIHYKIMDETKSSNYYLISSDGDDQEVINHELCHALYKLELSYKKEVTKILKDLLSSTHTKLKQRLLDMGYTKKVVDDEIQAYLAENSESLLDDVVVLSNEESDNLDIVSEKLHNNLSKWL